MIASWAGLVLLTIAWTASAFHDFGYFPFGDWDQYLSFFEIQRRSILDFGELPLWDPYLLGGIPGHAHPQFNCLSPYFAPILLWDLLPGTVVFFALHALTGCAGMYALARILRHSRAGAMLAGGVFLFCYAPFLSGGVVNRMNGSLIPWMVFFYLKAQRQPAYVTGLAITVLLLILEGGFYAIVGGGLVLGFLCLLQGPPSSVWRGLTINAVGFALGIGAGALRLWPTLNLYAQYPRDTAAYAGDPIWNPQAIASFPSAIAALLTAPKVGRRDELFGQPVFLGIDIGLPLLVLLLLAVVFLWRRWMLWLWLGLSLTLVLAASSPINGWAILKRGPGLHSLNLSMSLIFVLFIPLSLLIAGAAEATVERLLLKAQPKNIALWLTTLAVGWGLLLWQNWSLFGQHPRADLPDPAPVDTAFAQTWGAGASQPMLPAIRANQGIVRAYEEVIRERLNTPVLAPPQNGDRGEYWMGRRSSHVTETLFSNNRRVFSIDCRHADRLVINQNFFPGWRAATRIHPGKWKMRRV